MTDEEEKFQQTMERFLVSREGDEWQGFCEAVDQQLAANPDAEKIEVPTAFLREAITEIKTNPLIFPHMKEAHDRAAAAIDQAEGK